jgi:hypothetical protein
MNPSIPERRCGKVSPDRATAGLWGGGKDST